MKDKFIQGKTISIQTNLDTDVKIYTEFTYKKDKYSDDVYLEYLYNDKGQILIIGYTNEGIECSVDYAGLVISFDIKYEQIKFD